MRNEYESGIVAVAAKFYHQITDLLRKQPDVYKNEALQERTKKAAAYFGEKVQHILADGIKKVDLDVDNKEIKRQLKRYVNDLKDDVQLKLSAFESCLEGFDVKRLMDSRAKTLVKQSKSSGKQKAKEITDSENIQISPRSVKELLEIAVVFRIVKRWSLKALAISIIVGFGFLS